MVTIFMNKDSSSDALSKEKGNVDLKKYMKEVGP
jgi:hypothetical protein